MALPRFDLTSQTFKRNPFPTFATMRERGPLVRTRFPFVGEVWTTTTYDAATTILRDRDGFVTEPRNAGRKHYAGMHWWMPGIIKSLTNNMLGKDEPDHRRLRSLVESAFMNQSIDAMRPRLRELADEHLDHMDQQAERAGGQIDLVEHFARPFPLSVICELLGFPPEDRHLFLEWASSLTNLNTPLSFLKFVPGLWKLNRYFQQQFEICRKEPRPGMISALVQAELEGDKLSREELTAAAFLLLFAGHETTVHLLSGGVLTLLQHPAQKQELMADWSLSYDAVGEILRYYSSIQMTKPRYVSRDMELYGQHLRRGEAVMPLLAAGNADPARFEAPETFDIHRHPNPQLTFGTGMHICLGQKLAWAEAQIALERLFTRFPQLELGVAESELQWIERIGHRALKSLPLQLHAQGQYAAGRAA